MHRVIVLLCAFLVLCTATAMAEDSSKNPCLNKEVRTPAQRKIASMLLCEIYPTEAGRKIEVLQKDKEGRVLVDVRTRDVAATMTKIADLGGKVTYHSERHSTAQAYMPLDVVEKLAEFEEVKTIRPKSTATANPR